MVGKQTNSLLGFKDVGTTCRKQHVKAMQTWEGFSQQEACYGLEPGLVKYRSWTKISWPPVLIIDWTRATVVCLHMSVATFMPKLVSCNSDHMTSRPQSIYYPTFCIKSVPTPGPQSVEEKKLEASGKALRDSGRLSEGYPTPLRAPVLAV